MTKSTSLVPATRGSRIAKKSGGLAKESAEASSLPHDVIIYARQAKEVPAFFLDSSPESVTVRHKRGAGSSKQIISTFPRSIVVEQLGDVGDVGMLTIITRMPVRELRDQLVQVIGDIVVCTDVQTKEVTQINKAVQGVDVEMYVDEAVVQKRYGGLMDTASTASSGSTASSTTRAKRGARASTATRKKK